MSRVIETVDVICQHKSNGEVIPLRFRLMNEDGQYESYAVITFILMLIPAKKAQ